MKKVIAILLCLFTLFVFVGCNVLNNPATEQSVKIENIIDIAERDNLPTNDALELFYSDDTYNYYFSSIRSIYVIVYYNDGTEQTAQDALAEGKIKISDLDSFGIHYFKYHSELTDAFTLTYDYGRIVENTVTELFNYGFFFNVEFEESKIPLVAGDKLVFKHNGEFVSLETYPSEIRFEGEVINTYYLYTEIRAISEEDIVRNESGGIEHIKNCAYTSEYVIINENMEFVKLSEYKGDSLYFSIDPSTYISDDTTDPQPLSAAAFYAYNPRPD